MKKKGNLLVLFLFLLISNLANAETNTRVETSSERTQKAAKAAENKNGLGYLDSELAKDASQETKSVQLKSNSNAAKRNAEKAQNRQSKATISPGQKNKEKPKAEKPSSSSSLSSNNSWSPNINKETTAETLERIKKEEEEATILADNLFALNYNNFTPPKQLYNLSYEAKNRHLPAIYLKSDYFNMAFNAINKDDFDGLRTIITDKSFIDRKNKAGDTLLIYAISKNKINSARVLLAKGASVNLTNSKQRTALHYAAFIGNEEAVKLLLSMGANIDLPDNTQTTPFEYAALQKNSEILEIFNRYLRKK